MRRLIRIKNLLILFLVFIIAFLAFNFDDLKYGILQLEGQVEILSNSEDIEEVLISDRYPDSLKQKLRLVQEIKDFAGHELGLKVGNNYTTVYDQKGKDILWIVTAFPPF